MRDGSIPATPPSGRVALLATVAIALVALAGCPVALAQPTLAAPAVLAGPGTHVQLDGLQVGRDGSGGLVYLADVGGVAHVFAARLVGGVFQPPTQLDGGLAGPSSQAVITGTNGGVLQVAFINGGNLYLTGTASTTSPWTPPGVLAAAASAPSLSMNTYGESYLAYTATVGGGFDVDVDYFNGTGWSAASPQAVNATPGDDAGVGAGRPDIVSAGDGVAIVAWGENGHIYSRRVWGTSTSTELERLDPPSISGWGELVADSPSVSAGGDSSYPDIAFREEVGSGDQTQSRVLVTRLIAENTQSPVTVDGLTTPGSASADQPTVAMNEYGRGFVTSSTEGSDAALETTLGTNGSVGHAAVVGSGLVAPYAFPTNESGLGAPYTTPGIAGLSSTLITWQQTSADSGSQIVMRYAPDGSDLGTPVAVSAGGSNAALGLAAAGDVAGDAAIAWVQGSDALEYIDVAQLYQTPGAPTLPATLAYTRNIHPTLSWTASRAPWGPLSYTVTLDGTVLGQTSGTSLPIPQSLIDGPHVWQVKVSDPAGLASSTGRSTVFVDTQPPRLRIALGGVARVGDPVTLHLTAIDPANPTEPGSVASGIGSVTVRWTARGTATLATKLRSVSHVFTSAGFARVTVTAIDKAGNVTTIARFVRILPAT